MPNEDEPVEPRRGMFGQRFSASADVSRRAEIARVWAMSERERVALALSLGRRLAALTAEKTDE